MERSWRACLPHYIEMVVQNCSEQNLENGRNGSEQVKREDEIHKGDKLRQETAYEIKTWSGKANQSGTLPLGIRKTFSSEAT